MNERELREAMAMHGKSLFERGLTVGSSGNLSVRFGDQLLITPTNSCLGRLDPDRITCLDRDGQRISGDPASKEAFLHQSMYRSRPHEQAIVHLHSTYSVAVSCLADVDPRNVLPPLTAYYVMRVGNLPLVDYYAPGDNLLAEAVADAAVAAHSVLLSNHGPVVSGQSLEAAVSAIEELEETAKLFLLLRGLPLRMLTEQQQFALRDKCPPSTPPK